MGWDSTFLMPVSPRDTTKSKTNENTDNYAMHLIGTDRTAFRIEWKLNKQNIYQGNSKWNISISVY